MKFEKTNVYNFEGAFRGMRNPMNSWDKSDSAFFGEVGAQSYLGENDLKLAQKLIRAGGEHRKFMRQIFVSVDITAPLYWWKEFDTYKVGTVANSTSTMHKLASQPITRECFEVDDYNPSLYLIDPINLGVRVDCFIDDLEQLRQLHLMYKDEATKDGLTDDDRNEYKKLSAMYWKELVRWLPSGWLQTRTITMDYENIFNIIHQRSNHKLNEWSGKDNPDLSNFVSWAKTLPYANELLFIDKDGEV